MDSALANEQKLQGMEPSRSPEDSVKRMAVLFTDIVASSRFFQKFGDLAGRKMLRDHEAVASPAILEHGGVVVKMLGDSLMAYFFHPGEAVKAAIKIQNRLQEFNRSKNSREHIHVRIGVHFGEGILEEDDIFGDVVNMAAKFLPFVNGDEIGISHAVMEQVQSLPSLRFENVPLAEIESLPQGFQLYRVKWTESVDLEPLTKTLVYFRPLFALGKAGFRKTWGNLLNDLNRNHWVGVEKEVVLEDQSLAIIIKDSSGSLPAAKKVTDYLRLNLGLDGQLYLPVQIVIDIGPFLRGNKLDLDELNVHWEDLEPGRVYVSAPAYHVMKSRGALPGSLQSVGDQSKSFLSIRMGEEEKREQCLFLYQSAIIQGDCAPCFYCGDRRHPTGQCPSKRLTEPTNALGKLGYLPLEEINRVFFTCLNENGLTLGPPHAGGTDLNSPSSLACHAFYELKAVYQLRLFRTVWNNTEEDWNKAKEGRGEKNYGGLSWIAQDCIRVSNLEQAESILRESLVREADDYKPLFAMGVLQVEKGDFSQAKFYFKRALDRSQTTPQRILVLFMLSRLFQMQGDQVRAEEAIRRILRYNPYCTEALYEDILLQFRKGKEAIALHQLVKLIRKNREYYVVALIDPELAPHRDLIHPKIRSLLNETREEAKKIVERAREELFDLRKWLGNDEPETKDAEALLARIDELSKVNSFFSNMDILHYGTNLVGIGRSTLEERRRRILRILKELSDRHERSSKYVRNFPYRFLVSSLSEDLKRLHARISMKWGWDDSGEPAKFKDILQETERISGELTDIEAKLQRVEVLRRLLLFLSRFLKRTLIFQSANLLVAIILFPIVTYYLNLLLPGLKIGSQDIWLYQKSVLSLGSISGLLLALFTSGGDSGSRQALQR